MAKPTMVFVPGAWHAPEVYRKTMDTLNKHGYPTIGLPLPSAGANPPHTNFQGDVEGIRTCLKALIEEQGKDIILVSHSYTGMPANEAPVDLGRAHRAAHGLPGGVTRLVFINALAMPEGFQPTAGGAQFPAWMRVDAEQGVVRVTPDDAKATFYNDVDPDEASEWASRLLHQSLGVYSSVTTYCAWRYIPSTFVIGTEDRTSITPELSRFMIDEARKQVPSAFDVVETCQGGGHCLMVGHPEWLADVMRRAAGEQV